eukprot:s724_g40.t1
MFEKLVVSVRAKTLKVCFCPLTKLFRTRPSLAGSPNLLARLLQNRRSGDNLCPHNRVQKMGALNVAFELKLNRGGLFVHWVRLRAAEQFDRMDVEPPGPDPLSPPSDKRFSTYSRDMFDRRRDRHERSDRPERRPLTDQRERGSKALSMVLRHRQVPSMRADGFVPWEVMSGQCPACTWVKATRGTDLAPRASFRGLDSAMVMTVLEMVLALSTVFEHRGIVGILA